MSILSKLFEKADIGDVSYISDEKDVDTYLNEFLSMKVSDLKAYDVDSHYNNLMSLWKAFLLNDEKELENESIRKLIGYIACSENTFGFEYVDRELHDAEGYRYLLLHSFASILDNAKEKNMKIAMFLKISVIEFFKYLETLDVETNDESYCELLSEYLKEKDDVKKVSSRFLSDFVNSVFKDSARGRYSIAPSFEIGRAMETLLSRMTNCWRTWNSPDIYIDVIEEAYSLLDYLLIESVYCGYKLRSEIMNIYYAKVAEIYRKDIMNTKK